MAGIKVLLWWDTEDYINPESDEALRLLLQVHRDRQAPAVWKMVGEKSRALRQRGRQDIVELMADPLCEIGYHTDFHSAHPTVGEYTADLDWAEGVATMLARESQGLRDTQALLGKPVLCYGQPGASYTPHAYGAMAAWDIPAYLGDAAYLGLDDRPCYIMGRLSISWMAGAHGIFPARQGAAAMDVATRTINGHLIQPPAGRLISQGGHPNEWSLAEWWDEVNFRGGQHRSRGQWQPARCQSPAHVIEMVALYGQYIDWLRSQSIEPTCLSELFRLYGPGDFWLDADSAAAIARQWRSGHIDHYVDDGRGKSFSAAQALYGLAAMFVENKHYVAVPEVQPPTVKVATAPRSGPLPFSAVEAAALGLVSHVRACGALPVAIELGGEQVPLAVVAQGVANAWLGQPQVASQARLLPAERVHRYGRDVGPWPIHRADFDGENLARLAELLAWSLKPALLAV